MPSSPNPPLDSSPSPANSDAAGRFLERDVAISRSLIWRRQQEFYLERGLKAWTEDRVPSYITNNPFITQVYARMVAAYLRDCIELKRSDLEPLSAANPLRILELGAGTGKFAYLFLGELESLLRGLGMDPALVRYCMTDASEGVIDEWRRHKYLAKFVAKGMLEFELLRAEEQIYSRFLAGADAQEQQPGRGPLVVIANYVFDSLPQDAFRIEQGRISEFLMTTSISEHAPASPERLGSSPLSFSFRDALVPAERYRNTVWNRILDGYRARLSALAPGASITVPFPCGALAALEQILRFGDGRTLVIAADKGFAYEDNLALAQLPPAFEFHATNCFSQLVNLDAIAKYFESTGGRVLRPDKHTADFNICGFLAHRDGDRFSATEAAYRDMQQGFGPDDLFTLLAGMNAYMEQMTVAQILAVLRLTRWDTTALMRLFPVLSRQLGKVVVERYDLREAVRRSWANHFPVSPGDNEVAFYCGVILLGLKFFEEAAAMFRESQKLLGSTAAISYNLGLCAQGLGRRQEALAAMKEACSLDPGFQPAQDAVRRLENSSPAS